jgi:hypothetical protein
MLFCYESFKFVGFIVIKRRLPSTEVLKYGEKKSTRFGDDSKTDISRCRFLLNTLHKHEEQTPSSFSTENEL